MRQDLLPPQARYLLARLQASRRWPRGDRGEVGIVGTVEVQPVNSKVMHPFRTVTIRFGAPMQMEAAGDPSDPLADHDHTICRAFTDDLMREIAHLSEREYVDEYVPARTRAAAA